MIRRVGLLRITRLYRGERPPKGRKRKLLVRRRAVWFNTREELVRVIEALQRTLQEPWEWPTEALRVLAAVAPPAGFPGRVSVVRGEEATVESDELKLLVKADDVEGDDWPGVIEVTTLWSRSLKAPDPE